MSTLKSLRHGGCLFLVAALLAGSSAHAADETKLEPVAVLLPAGASARVEFGAEKLAAALNEVGVKASLVRDKPAAGPARRIAIHTSGSLAREGFAVKSAGASEINLNGGDDSGALYGCLELARQVRAAGRLPDNLDFSDKPVMTLRGACVGMQKTAILPGRKVYEYPYSPDLFPWFYDQELWREYLDSLVANRMNTLYLWNGHPFASLVKLPDYPEAVEVPDDVFQKNVAMFRWLTGECDKRGIWLVQMFYNIFLPKPLAEKHGVATQLSAPTPLAADYTRKSIAEFVKQYPNVGLMVCLGEALQGTTNQIEWATKTILPGVLDGMKAASLKTQPPVVIRTHAMNAEAIMPACFAVYSNLFTETKYNGESLTTYEPRGKVQTTHRAMAKLGPHLVNVHILSNLEPFRYGAQRFIQKSMQAAHDRYDASGLHLYPLAYWNWPYAADLADPPLKQWERDWIWFEAWARYAWNPDLPEAAERTYWIARLADFYGCDADAAGKILDALNDAGEVAPMLIRRFGITEGNRQTLSLGMTLDQLVNPKRYNAIPDLWESLAPPGERLDEFVRKEIAREPHVGETPESVTRDAEIFSARALVSINAAAARVTKNRAEFARLQGDLAGIQQLSHFYLHKVQAALAMLRYESSKDQAELARARQAIALSVEDFQRLTTSTTNTYAFVNSMQTGHRKIPFGGAASGVGTNYHWSQVLPLYRKELADFNANIASNASGSVAPIAAWPAAKFTLLGTNAETYQVRLGARPFADRKYTLTELAPELNGLTGIRFSHEAAKNGRYEPVEFEVTEPVRVLVGYFQNERDLWLQVPNLDVASHADERGGVDAVLRNAMAIDECPNVNVHAFRYEPGRYRLELIGKGSFVILGVVPQAAKLEKRDAKLGIK